MWVKKQEFKSYIEQLCGSKLVGSSRRQGCTFSLCVFNFYAEYIMQNIKLDESQAGIKIARRNMNNFRYVDDSILMAESEDKQESFDDDERGERKSWFKKSKFKKLRSWHPVQSLHGK